MSKILITPASGTVEFITGSNRMSMVPDGSGNIKFKDTAGDEVAEMHKSQGWKIKKGGIRLGNNEIFNSSGSYKAFTDGTAGSPALRGSDGDTGLYFTANTSLHASVNGSERLVIGTSTTDVTGALTISNGLTLTGSLIQLVDLTTNGVGNETPLISSTYNVDSSEAIAGPGNTFVTLVEDVFNVEPSHDSTLSWIISRGSTSYIDNADGTAFRQITGWNSTVDQKNTSANQPSTIGVSAEVVARGDTSIAIRGSTSHGRAYSDDGSSANTHAKIDGHWTRASAYAASGNTSTVTEMSAVRLDSKVDSSNVFVTDMFGVNLWRWGFNTTPTTGSIDNAYGIYITSPLQPGFIGNTYGLYMADISGAKTGSYAIYSVGGDSYFGGNVGIGTTTPDFTLDVAGHIGMDGNLYHNGDHDTYIGFTADTITLRTGGTDAVTVDSSQNITTTGDITIGGNLTVSGTTTTVDSNTVNIGDNIIVLNSDEAGTPSQDAGIEIERGTSSNKQFLWDEGNDRWDADDALNVQGALTATSYGGITEANLVDKSADETLTGQWTFPSDIANRPIIGGGFLSRATSDGNHDLWGISEDYYPSHGTSSNAWGLQWNGDSNSFYFVGNGSNQVIMDMDNGNITSLGNVSAATIGGITEANLVDKSAAETISAGWTFTGTGIYFADTNTRLYEGTSNSVRVTTDSGYVDIGPMNSGYAHFQTDRPEFYFNKAVRVDGTLYGYGTEDLGTVGVPWGTIYGTDLNLDNGSVTLSGSAADKLRWLTTDDGEVAGDLTSDSAMGILRLYDAGVQGISINPRTSGTSVFSSSMHVAGDLDVIGDGSIGGNLGVGTTSPGYALDIYTEVSSGGASFHKFYTDPDTQINWRMRRGRGTIASPSQSLANDLIGVFSFWGYSNSGSWKRVGGIGSATREDITGTASSGFLYGDVRPSGSVDVRLFEADASLWQTMVPLTVSGSVTASADMVVDGTFALGRRFGGGTNSRTVLIEGTADGGGEGAGRIFFTEHNSSDAFADSYGLSLYYEGHAGAALPSGFQPSTGNATWSLRRHDNSLDGVAIMSGIRTSGNVTFAADINVTGDVGGATIGGITEANLVDKSASETVSGAWTFSSALTATDQIIGTAGDATWGLGTATSLVLGTDGSKAGAIKLWGGTASAPGYIQMTTYNMHLDPSHASGNIYLGWYGGTGDVYFGKGSGSTALKLDASADKLIFGASSDTNLYRSAANTLATDDSFSIGSNLYIGGTVTNGTWNGTAIASAYLDADTAHLTTNQTFSGVKTFSAPVTASAGLYVSSSVGAATVFKVEGTSGSLFEVNDSFDGILMSVNDIGGVPIMAVSSSGMFSVNKPNMVYECDIIGTGSFTGGLITEGRSVVGSATLNATYELYTVGDIGATGDVVAYVSSDSGLKDNIQVIPNALNVIENLRGVTWDWNELATDAARETPGLGVVAQEVEEVLPQLVIDRDTGYKAVDYERLTAVLIEAVKEQQSTIHQLEVRVTELESRL